MWLEDYSNNQIFDDVLSDFFVKLVDLVGVTVHQPASIIWLLVFRYSYITSLWNSMYVRGIRLADGLYSLLLCLWVVEVDFDLGEICISRLCADGMEESGLLGGEGGGEAEPYWLGGIVEGLNFVRTFEAMYLV